MEEGKLPLEGKYVFLSGPMTGIEHNNVKEFARAHATVRELGAERIYNPALAWLTQPLYLDAKRTHADYMATCLNELTKHNYHQDERSNYYDLVVLLPEYYLSEGSVIEHKVAHELGIETVYLPDLEETHADVLGKKADER